MKQQPGGRRLGGPIRQQIDRAARVEIDEDGAVGATFAHGPIVDPQPLRGGRGLLPGELADQAQEGIGTAE
jgi:hypothetical protein